jgi:hypothetical protein
MSERLKIIQRICLEMDDRTVDLFPNAKRSRFGKIKKRVRKNRLGPKSGHGVKTPRIPQ